MTQLMNYDLIQAFNGEFYKDLLFPTQISDDEIFVSKARDSQGVEVPYDEFFLPMKKNRTNYLLPADYVNKLPVKVERIEKISVAKKAYTVILSCSPAGFGAEKTFDTVKEFVEQFCDYEHTSPEDFWCWKIIALTAYVSRINVRVASAPAFGKDSVMRVINALAGDVGIVHNPTVAKIEYLLTNKVLMTNEVAGIAADEIDNLSQYYLTCGDFSNTYEKRAVANYKGSHNTYDLGRLSNLVCFNDIDCYPEKKQDKYFDKMFQRAVLERFLEFRFGGKITERFGANTNVKQIVTENVGFYKKNIKMLKYLEENLDKEIHGYKPIPHTFTDRAMRNWETICLFVDAASESQEEYEQVCRRLMERHHDYHKMLNGHKQTIAQKYENDLNNPASIPSKGAFAQYETPDGIKVTEVMMNKVKKIEEDIL